MIAIAADGTATIKRRCACGWPFLFTPPERPRLCVECRAGNKKQSDRARRVA